MDCLTIVMIMSTFMLVNIMFLRQILIMDSLQRIQEDIEQNIKENMTDASSPHLRGKIRIDEWP